MPNQYSLLSPSNRVYLWATAGLVVLLGASLLFYRFGSRSPQGSTNTSTTNTINGIATTNVSTNVPPVAPEPETLTSRSGTITRVLKSSIRFQTPVYNSTLHIYEQKEVTAEYDGNTIISEIDRRGFTAPPVPGQQSTAPAKTAIEPSALKIGDIVDVYAASDIKDATTFTATEINRLLL